MTIFVVEDDDNIREMIKMALTSFSYETAAFSNAEDALSAIPSTWPDMIILDIMLPGISGLDAVKKLRNDPKTRNLPVIMLTAKDTEMDKVTGLDCGADDYIAKPFGVMELNARIRALVRRTEKNEADIAVSDLSINTNTREVTQAGKLLDLTYKEYELLCLLVRERGRVVPRDEILNTIWGYDFVGETRTLDIHIRTLRQKLRDDAENPNYIKTARNVGYRFIGGAV